MGTLMRHYYEIRGLGESTRLDGKGVYVCVGLPDMWADDLDQYEQSPRKTATGASV
jgi:hypothetical protein